MKKKILSLVLVLCVVVTLLPTVALADGPTAPTVDGMNIYANGVPIKIVAGTTADYTNILYDINNDGTIGNTEYLQIGSPPSEAGYDLSLYTVFGGVENNHLTGDSNITIDGGSVGSVYGGCGGSYNLSGSVSITMNGGSVSRLLACGFDGAVGGTGENAAITINGGTVRGDVADDVNLTARLTSGTTSSLTITGGSICGTISGPAPTNGTENVYKTALTFIGSTATANSAVTVLTADAGYDYGMEGVMTNASGQLFVYLPAGKTVTAGTIGGITYFGSVTTLDTGAATGNLFPGAFEPTYGTSAVYANGTPIKIVAGTAENCTNILYDIDKNGSIDNTEYLKIGDDEPTAAGYNLSGYSVYGGSSTCHVGGDTHITMESGKIDLLYRYEQL